MRSALRAQFYVCLDCRLQQSQHVRRRFQSSVVEAQRTPQTVDLAASLPPNASNSRKHPRTSATHSPQSRSRVSATIKSLDEPCLATQDAQATPALSPKDVAIDTNEPLSLPEKHYLRAVNRLRQRLQVGIESAIPLETVASGLLFENAVKAAKLADTDEVEKHALDDFKTTYTGQDVSVVMKDIKHVRAPRPLQRVLLSKLGFSKDRLLSVERIRTSTSNGRLRQITPRSRKATAVVARKSPTTSQNVSASVEKIHISASGGRTHRFPLRFRKISAPLVRKWPTTIGVGTSQREATDSSVPARRIPNTATSNETKRSIPKFDNATVHTLRETSIELEPLVTVEPTVPALSFDLSRVLFNPGVYQLQDPRSRVYNFSPYLQRILPVSEFNFDVLNEYITSSKDSSLRDLGLKCEKKYLGSSSSMTGVLTHFHFLLSAWRPINTKTLSQSFTDPLRSFTSYQRGPAAIFLRWKDGIYAVDADKEYDSANILMSLGKSMEKLLTLEEGEFERYRKSAQEQGVLPKPKPEAYHYTQLGDFLLRSQLDAYDPRLPGTGMFDLKTRAVVSIRMNSRDHEKGMGYEIQKRFGDMESYEREYFDMIRSAFLKYSLQVRMGRMDGIFVAFHNIERIFGFQYISLPEMDSHLHGTENRNLGDTEFKLSLGLLNKIFDRATSKMPNTSIRFHFETRDLNGTEGSCMYILAEAQTEEEIENIQNSKQAEIAEFEARIFNSSDPAKEASPAVHDHFVASDGSVDDAAAEMQRSNSSDIKAGAIASPEQLSEPSADNLMGFILRTRSRVNGLLKVRPVDLEESDSWDLEYTLEEIPHARAMSLYNQIRGRRRKLATQHQKEDAAADFYVRKMKGLAENGRNVRKNIDRNDTGRPVVVLDRVQH